jgi:uncharacterized protein (DUF2384 family)
LNDSFGKMTSREVKATIVGRMAYIGIANKEMAVKMGMHLRTWQRRLQNPESFTVGELEKVQKVLKVEL